MSGKRTEKRPEKGRPEDKPGKPEKGRPDKPEKGRTEEPDGYDYPCEEGE